jgi:hypothetical protein
MATIQKVGIHYVNVDEIVCIRYMSHTVGNIEVVSYEFMFKNGLGIKVWKQEFEEFKKHCDCLYDGVVQEAKEE